MFETIEDVLVTLHTGQWFGFNGDKVYENLWVADGYDKPTEEELNTLLSTKQTEYDAKDWERNRLDQYPSLEDCIHALLDGGDTLTDLQALRTQVKSDNPKPS